MTQWRARLNTAHILTKCHNYSDLDLFNPRALETQVKGVVTQAPHLHVVAVVAHADDGHLGVFDQLNQFLRPHNNNG